MPVSDLMEEEDRRATKAIELATAAARGPETKYATVFAICACAWALLAIAGELAKLRKPKVRWL